MDFEIHTDGAAIWVDCLDCEETIVQFFSLPIIFAEMAIEIRDHTPVCGTGDEDDE